MSDRWKCCECGGRLLNPGLARAFEWVESQQPRAVRAFDLAAALQLSAPGANNLLRALAQKGFLMREARFLAGGGSEFTYWVTPGWPVVAHRREAAL